MGGPIGAPVPPFLRHDLAIASLNLFSRPPSRDGMPRRLLGLS